MTMARFALFGSAESPSSQPSSSTPSSSASLTSLRQSPKADCQSDVVATADRRISSNPSITMPESSSDLNLDQTGCQSQSMRASHSDTNLMERFRKGNFVASFVGVRKSFSLQKRKSKKDKKKKVQESNTDQSVSSNIDLSSDNAFSTKQFAERFVSISDEPDETPDTSVQADERPPPAIRGLPSSASDYVLHSRSLSHQLAQSTSHWNDSNSNTSDQQLASVSSTRSLKSKKCSSLRPYSKQHSTTSSYEQSLKKSWLYPMTFMNCCLTRTDSVPDVYLDSIGTAANISQSNCNSDANAAETNELQQMVALERLPGEPNDGQFAEHLIDERMLIQSLNDLFLRTSRNASPNQMISLNNQQTRSERERAIYLEEASGEAELNSSFNFPPPPPADDDEFQELRQILNNHQSSMSTFSHPDPNRLFPSSNYPLQLGRMLHALPAAGQSRAQSLLQDSAGAHGEPSWNHHSPNPHSISNFSSVLPYPPPALYRSQRHLRAHTNPVHTQIDYINCLVPDLKAISSCSFYWGKMDRYEAERLLEGKPEGTFLLRDSAQEDHLFSVSFRRFDRSLHARIEQWKHRFSFDSHDPGVYSSTTVTGLIEHYKDPSHCMFFEPMLTKPLNRNFVFSLQHLARAGICDLIRYESINELPLPIVLKSYLRQYHFSIKVRTKHFDEFTYYQ